MTIRQELALMGVDRVRAAMVAFHMLKRTPECYCFLDAAFGGGQDAITDGREHLGCKAALETLAGAPVVEQAFEGWHGTLTRADLYAECVLFLAEHGVAVERAQALHQEGAR